MKYLYDKRKEVSSFRITVMVLAGAFIVIFAIREYVHYSERRSWNSETWAISPENGFVMKMEKVPMTIEERTAEYKAHVRDFLTHWYQFDQYTFIDNTNYGANLIDRKTRDNEINKYREDNTYATIQERDIILSIVVKDISIDVTQRPYTGQFSIVQSLRSKQNLKKRIIEGTFEISDTEGRSFSNPHAAVISNYKIQRIEETNN